MSKDWTFKQHMMAGKFENMIPFGKFTAMYDLGELFVDERKELTLDDKIELFQKLLDYHIEKNIDLRDSTCADVSEFLYDYCDYMKLFSIDEKWKELESKLDEMKTNDENLSGLKSFQLIKEYCVQIGLWNENKDVINELSNIKDNHCDDRRTTIIEDDCR